MGKPAFLEKLRHGLALCGKNFPRFVETFNWCAESVLNLKGDGDDNEYGAIKVEWANPNRPVIRCDTRRITEAFTTGKGCWQATLPKDGSSVYFENCYYKLGERIRLYSGGVVVESLNEDDNFFALVINTTFSSSTATIENYSSYEDMRDAADIMTHVVVPLYHIRSSQKEEGETTNEFVVDFRNIPRINVIE